MEMSGGRALVERADAEEDRIDVEKISEGR